ncbi:TonB-dependent receptor [Mucilaginibacter sp. RS28]|uniref:TonB-dependent receptor n=1 Tax=Mucilaginibacter straminoryzae TaxID=2932774 RepID=A0A9X2BCK6_9SPHI|nr:TonB-dependent receptor [Mucilaginibacter straminoryzae]MCJ8209403.1 TonB-dependent receptor [Mucilaginibacter straminoryzae]
MVIHLRLVLLVLFLFANSNVLWAQYLEIAGVILDKQTNQPIAFGTVAVKGHPHGTTTESKGRFSLKLTEQAFNSVLIASCIGYRSDTLKLMREKKFYTLKLEPVKSHLNEVVVTGVSRATLARENPIPVVGVSTKKIEQAAESNIVDVLVKSVPGLNAVKTGPNISKPFIRGLGYNRVLTLYDGIRQEGQQWGDEHGIEVDAYHIVRAEVVKGPSSLIYGSDALAGVVGLIPAGVADSGLRGKYFGEYQSNNGLIGNGMRLTYRSGRWSYVAAASYRIARNYTNQIDGRVYNTGFREMNALGTVKYSSAKGYSSLNLTLYNNLQGIPDGSRDSLARRFTYQVAEGAADDVTKRPIVPENILNSYQLSPLHQHIQHYRVYTKNQYSIGAGDIDFSVAFQQNIRREYNHPTQPDQAGMYVRLNTVNYAFNYNVPLFNNTMLSTGINGMYQDNKSKDATDFPIPDYRLFDAGAYAFLKWSYERWTVGGGLRYDQRFLRGKDFYTATDPVTGFSRRVAGNINNAYLQFPTIDQQFNGVSLSLGTTYKVSEQLSLKANIARGYRAPSITEYASNGLDPGAHIVYLGNRSFEPEFSLQEDLGGEFSNQYVSASLSVFNNNITNYIYLTQLTDASGNSITDAQGNKTYQYQQSRAQLYGLEATLSIIPEGMAGFSFDNAFTINYGFNRSVRYKGAGIQGEFLPLIPPFRLLSSIQQEFKLKQGWVNSFKFKAEADFNGAQNRFLALNNTETATAGYTLIDLSAGAEIRYTRQHCLQLMLQVNNIFDTPYQSHLNRLKYFEYYSQSPNGRTGIYNMGRNICLKAVLPF